MLSRCFGAGAFLGLSPGCFHFRSTGGFFRLSSGCLHRGLLSRCFGAGAFLGLSFRGLHFGLLGRRGLGTSKFLGSLLFRLHGGLLSFRFSVGLLLGQPPCRFHFGLLGRRGLGASEFFGSLLFRLHGGLLSFRFSAGLLLGELPCRFHLGLLRSLGTSEFFGFLLLDFHGGLLGLRFSVGTFFLFLLHAKGGSDLGRSDLLDPVFSCRWRLIGRDCAGGSRFSRLLHRPFRKRLLPVVRGISLTANGIQFGKASLFQFLHSLCQAFPNSRPFPFCGPRGNPGGCVQLLSFSREGDQILFWRGLRHLQFSWCRSLFRSSLGFRLCRHDGFDGLGHLDWLDRLIRDRPRFARGNSLRDRLR